MPQAEHAQIGHFRAPFYLGIGSVSLLLNVNIIKEGHTTLIPEEYQVDHEGVKKNNNYSHSYLLKTKFLLLIFQVMTHSH